MYIPLSDDEHRFLQKFTSHVQTVTESTDAIVTQLLRYQMPLLCCMQPFNYVVTINGPTSITRLGVLKM